MAYRCAILDSADSDRENIVSFLIESLGSINAAGQFIDDLNRIVKKLSEYPAMFPISRMPELAEKGYRSASFGCYIVLYTFADQAVFIEHIFHQRQDYAYLT